MSREKLENNVIVSKKVQIVESQFYLLHVDFCSAFILYYMISENKIVVQ